MVLMNAFKVRPRMVRALVGAGILLVLGGPTWALEGQGAPTGTRPQVYTAPLALTSVASGWLGFRIRYEVTTAGARLPAGGVAAGGTAAGDRTHRVRVEEVVRGGPAQAAGMAAGDRILEINGMEGSRAIERGILSGVQPGQVVRFTVERDGRTLEVRVSAASRPDSATPAPTVAMARIRTDSIVSLMQFRMDSARASVAREAVMLKVTRPEPPPERRSWVVSRSGFPVEVSDAADSRVRVTGTGTQTLRALVSGVGEGGGDGATVLGSATAGPVLVLATGQRAVLGAEVTPLNPGLAGYFGVDAGLLVTQVVEGAPGARGGLTPGDVIVRVGSHPVATVEEFRAASEVAFRSPPLELGVIRAGRRLELRIPR